MYVSVVQQSLFHNWPSAGSDFQNPNVEHGQVPAELLSFMKEMRETLLEIRVSDFSKMYTRLLQQSFDRDVKVNSTRLKKQWLSIGPCLQEFKTDRDVSLAFKEDMKLPTTNMMIIALS